jgi:cystathionine beta-lyase/cystathionine gamma-synthase
MLEKMTRVLENMPSDWLNLTTHRLDIYNEEKAKVEFIEAFEKLVNSDDISRDSLKSLPTAYDYIRLGHPLSSILEWMIGNQYKVSAEAVVSFSSSAMPIFAVLRANHFRQKATRIAFQNNSLKQWDTQRIRDVYGYSFETIVVDSNDTLPEFDGTTVWVTQTERVDQFEVREGVDFYVNVHPELGSVIMASGEENRSYVSEIQHVRRRESIAMTPINCSKTLEWMTGRGAEASSETDYATNKASVEQLIREITHTNVQPVIGSSGLSVQYAIMMGLIDHAQQNHPNKAIKIIVPPNCYGGTNDQARRVAACLDGVDIMDLPVDGDNDMVQSTEQVLERCAAEDAVPLIIAEIPTNPRVEVPDLEKLRDALAKKRHTPDGKEAISPVFILDQTFCPNVNFLGENQILSSVQTIAYVSGSKFPSGGKCTAGYVVANDLAAFLMKDIQAHIELCDNEATPHQMAILAEQLPSMNQRIADAYKNTREFVNFIKEVLPESKINFVSEELAERGFTPSVFSLDLPTKGNTDQEREDYKRAMNLKLIDRMITQIPNESKYCVSYGQLKGCYWTIPATSTQGTTKEDDKDYIARVSVSPDLDLDKHKAVFREFVAGLR